LLLEETDEKDDNTTIDVNDCGAWSSWSLTIPELQTYGPNDHF